MRTVEVIEDPEAATSALNPLRARLLAELSEPASAAALAARVGQTRQKVNYHLNALLAHGLVREVDTRRWGGLTERRVVATAGSYVVSPSALGPLEVSPDRTTDRLSASYLIALAARAVREVGDLVRRALESDKRLATLSIDTEVRFRSAAERAEFSAELSAAIADLAARYHDEHAPGGRPHRVVVLAHPLARSLGVAPSANNSEELGVAPSANNSEELGVAPSASNSEELGVAPSASNSEELGASPSVEANPLGATPSPESDTESSP